ncbi:dioxygenase [Xanthomonas arboricola pv. juglandis]|uniref:dioxygenase family protein n=1 Tax=Xanthomonas TaxID=338 RepID=UPI000E5AF484|nr:MULTISPECIES: class III extradiol ring-cleavage dioxygenase [Xanthomonas]CAD1796317.1 dioxygenase [Xanthomonas sp. CPBF 426]CAG2095976.1 dioxygenase [Xanthomonas euroxanthea]SYZ51369.1 dioxygenase [Xanthomonas arboricola pv. juglandis]
MTRAPSLFISHGSPMFAIEPGVLGPNLQQLGTSLRDLSAIVVVSPHWQTIGIRVAGGARPATIHDFGGFPAPLYALKYEPPGAPDLAADIVDLLIQAGLPATIDSQRGLDHGAWVPLRYLKPDADVPVLQVSLPRTMDAEGALRLGRTLAPLRDRGVLIVGSGSLTHNLYEFRSDVRDPEYAQEFADWIAAAIARGDDAALLRYRTQAPHAGRAHPTQEHYLPLLVAVGASVPNESRSLIRGGMTYGVLSMDSFGFGVHTDAMEDAA